ncbi:hypothetical protein niasHT_011710 [Heterodera trifolii]|uniref:Uncharacterized protein n=1 Tax=Heterodera trifolii TaxID=157864 RepID=A0ABD2KYE4_9BILA
MYTHNLCACAALRASQRAEERTSPAVAAIVLQRLVWLAAVLIDYGRAQALVSGGAAPGAGRGGIILAKQRLFPLGAKSDKCPRPRDHRRRRQRRPIAVGGGGGAAAMGKTAPSNRHQSPRMIDNHQFVCFLFRPIRFCKTATTNTTPKQQQTTAKSNRRQTDKNH